MNDIGDIISLLIVAVAAANGFAAWLANRSFNSIRRTDVGDRFVISFSVMALSWGLFSLAAQQFFPEPSDLRNALVIGGLLTKLAGVGLLISGLYMLKDSVGNYR